MLHVLVFFMVDGLEKGQLSVLFCRTVPVQRRLFSAKSLQRVVELKKLSKYKMWFEFSSNTLVSSFTTRSPSGPSLNHSFQYKLEKRKDILEKTPETRFSFQISPACFSCTF